MFRHPAQTNLLFFITVENLITDRSAPSPELVVGLNLTPDGAAVDPNLVDVEDAFVDIELSPQAPDTRCILSHALFSEAAEIPAGDSVEFIGMAGPIAAPAPEGVTLFVRAFGAPEWTEFSLPWPPGSLAS